MTRKSCKRKSCKRKSGKRKSGKRKSRNAKTGGEFRTEYIAKIFPAFIPNTDPFLSVNPIITDDGKPIQSSNWYGAFKHYALNEINAVESNMHKIYRNPYIGNNANIIKRKYKKDHGDVDPTQADLDAYNNTLFGIKTGNIFTKHVPVVAVPVVAVPVVAVPVVAVPGAAVPVVAVPGAAVPGGQRFRGQ